MVYCSRCGTKNKEDTKHCIKCGTPLYLIKGKHKEEDVCFGRTEGEIDRKIEEECFWIPYGGALIGVILGVFIIIIGLAIVFKLEIWHWIGTLIMIIVGLLIIIGALFGFRRR